MKTLTSFGKFKCSIISEEDVELVFDSLHTLPENLSEEMVVWREL